MLPSGTNNDRVSKCYKGIRDVILFPQLKPK